MTSSNGGDRLDRIEALLEATNQTLAEVSQRVDSNAKSIQALSEERREYERSAQRDRARLYQEMANLSSAQADFYQRMEQMDERQETLSRRQGEIVEILKLLQRQQGSS